MGRNVKSVKLDDNFKVLFTLNSDMLHSFVSSVLDIPIERIDKLQAVESDTSSNDEIINRQNRLNVSMLVDGEPVNVEIQVKNDNDYRDWTLFYWAKLYSEGLKSVDNNGMLKRTIVVNIVSFNMLPGDNYHNEIVTAVKGSEEVFSDKFAIHVFELKKLANKLSVGNMREMWLHYISADTEEQLEELKKMGVPIIERAVDALYELCEDSSIREQAHGLKDSMERGAKANKSDVIVKLKQAGFSESEIVKILGL